MHPIILIFVLIGTYTTPPTRADPPRLAIQNRIHHVRHDPLPSGHVSVRFGLNEHVCAGTVLADRWVLTAASCQFYLAGVEDQPLVVTVNQQVPAQLYYVNRIFTHPLFDAESYKHDIALLRLRRALPDMLKPISLGEPAERATTPRGGDIVEVVTQITEHGSVHDRLELTPMRTLPPQSCAFHVSAKVRPFVHAETMCAFPRTYYAGMCHHETGSAVLMDGRLVAIGARQMCERGNAELLTLVLPYMLWIEITMLEEHVLEDETAETDGLYIGYLCIFESINNCISFQIYRNRLRTTNHN